MKRIQENYFDYVTISSVLIRKRLIRVKLEYKKKLLKYAMIYGFDGFCL